MYISYTFKSAVLILCSCSCSCYHYMYGSYHCDYLYKRKLMRQQMVVVVVQLMVGMVVRQPDTMGLIIVIITRERESLTCVVIWRR